ncbi:MAG: NERD domain-containing protein [Bacilli bacterium]|nr:NERD domain-containing protein [Bacilli bacterium]
MPYSVRLSIFIVVATIVGLLVAFMLLYAPVKRILNKNFTIRMYYRRVRRVVDDRDMLLINNFKNYTAEQEAFHIDHIVIGEKFFYVIRDRYYDGALAANAKDNRWVFYRGEESRLIPNPMLRNELRVERMSLMSNIPSQEIISIVLINDDCLLTPVEDANPNSYIVSLKKLPKLIAQLEATPGIAPLQPRDAEIAARDLAELNRNGKV